MSFEFCEESGLKSILGLDIGYGANKIIYMNSNGEITHQFKFVSAIGITNRNSFVKDNRIYDFKDHYYYVGDDALRLPSENMVDITEYKNLEYYAPLFLYKAIKEIGEIPDIVVTGLSKAQIENSGYFKDALSNFEVNGEKFSFEKLYILPKGAGSKIAIDKYGDDFPNEQKAFTGNSTYIGVDIGMNTTDLWLVTKGKTSPNLFEGIEHSGVMKIAAEIAKKVKELYGRDIKLHEAEEIINTKVYKLRGQRHDFSPIVKQIKEQYIKDLMTMIYDKYPDQLDKCDFIYLTGGGSSFFNTSDNGFIRVPKSNWEFYNAIGFALWGDLKTRSE